MDTIQGIPAGSVLVLAPMATPGITELLRAITVSGVSNSRDLTFSFVQTRTVGTHGCDVYSGFVATHPEERVMVYVQVVQEVRPLPDRAAVVLLDRLPDETVQASLDRTLNEIVGAKRLMLAAA